MVLFILCVIDNNVIISKMEIFFFLGSICKRYKKSLLFSYMSVKWNDLKGNCIKIVC